MLKALSKILGGGVAAQSLNFISLPILGKLYAPEAFGEYVLVVSIVTLFSLLCSFQLNQALLLIKRNLIVQLVMEFISKMTIAIILILSCVTEFIVFWVLDSQPMLNIGSRLMMYLAIYFATQNVVNMHMFIRQGGYNAIASLTFIRVLSLISSQISIAYTEISLNGLITGYLFSEVVVCLLSRSVVRKYVSERKMRLSKRKMSYILTRFIRYIKVVTTQEVLNNASQNMPIYIINVLFNASIAGSFSLAMRLINAPSQLLANSIRPVVLNKMLTNDRQGNTKLLKLSTAVIIIFCLLGLAVFYGVHQWLVSTLFEDKWVLLPEFTMLLAFWSVCMIINVPSISYLKVKEHLEFLFKYNVALIFARAIALLLGSIVSVYFSIVCFVFISIAFNAFVVVYAILISEKEGLKNA